MDATLVGYWPLDDGAGTTAEDASGYNHPGVLSGSWSAQAAPVNFANSGSISLNGAAGQGVVMPLVTTAVDNLTLSAWVNWAGTNDQPQAILYNGTAGADGYGIILQADGTLAVSAGAAGLATATYKLTAGTWQNVIAIRAAGTWKLYLDGKLIPLSGNPLPTAPGAQTTIGRANNDEAFNGLIDDARIYTRVLKVSEFAWKVFPLYIANYSDNNIIKVDANGVQSVLSAGGLIQKPDGITVDNNGILYIANYDTHKIIKVDPNTGQQTLLTSAGVISFPDGLAFDSNYTTLYVASLLNNRIVKVNPGSGAQTTLTTGGNLSAPSGLAFDSSGMLFVTSFLNNAVVKVDPANGAQSLITSGGNISGPNALAFDHNGMLFVTNELNHSVVKVDPATGEQSIVAINGDLNNAYALVFYNGDLYVSSANNHKVVKIDPDTGEQTPFISNGLLNGPTGIAFGPNYEADLGLTMTDAPDPVAAGNNLTYTLTLNNNGADPAYAVEISDVLPANTTFVSADAASGWSASLPAVGETGTVTFTRSSVHSSETATFEITVKVDDGTANGTTLTNTASAASAYPVDPQPGNNSATVETSVVRQADLSLSKSDQGLAAAPGEVIVYTLQYANAGPHEANNTQLMETIPDHAVFNAGASSDGWACVNSTCTLTLGTLAGGASGAATFAVTVDNPVAAGVSQLSNTASIESSTSDPDPANNSASDSTPVMAAPDLSLTKSDGSTTAIPGQTLQYTLTYANTGDQDAEGVVLTETIPVNAAFNAGASSAGWACSPNNTAGSTCTYTVGALASGDGDTLTFALTIAPSAPDGGPFSNTASIADNGSNGADPNQANNSATDTNTLSAQADLQLVKSAPADVQGNENFTYTLTITNNGPSDANAVVLTDILPGSLIFVAQEQVSGSAFSLARTGSAITDEIATLASGASAEIQITVRADSGAVIPAAIENTATLSSSTDDPDEANNTSSVETAVIVQSSETTLQSSLNPAVYGQEISFTAAVSSPAGSPEGTVAFKDNNSPIPGCQAVPLTNGQAVCTTADLTAGPHSITAAYSGSAAHNPSTSSPAVEQQIEQASPVLTWNTPANIAYPTELSDIQLNASANVPGEFTYSPAAATVLTVGVHTLTANFTPTDTLNYTVASTSVEITVIDAHAPVVTVPASQFVNAAGPSGVLFTFESSAVDNVDGDLTPVCSPPSGSLFPIGATNVQCSATDAAGNTGNASFTVTVMLQYRNFLPISIR